MTEKKAPFQCPFCDAPMPQNNSAPATKEKCPLCGNVTYVPNPDDLAKANSDEQVKAETSSDAGENEVVKYCKSPAMFRNSPILFLLACVLVPFIIGAVWLLIWWLTCKNTLLTVTDKRVQVKTGLLSKNTNDIWLKDVRNVVVNQTLFQRIFNVGKIDISTSGQSGFEVVVNGMVGPQEVAAMIRQSHF